MVFNGAAAHDQDGTTVAAAPPSRCPTSSPSVGAGDFEGTVTFGLGVQKRTSYTVRSCTAPTASWSTSRAGFPTTTRKVWLVDRDAVATGTPRTSSRSAAGPRRRARPPRRCTRCSPGRPRPERAAGLRLVRSRAWGFDDLQIASGIARVRLTRGCGSGGSTITVAGEIVPTLRQFPTVDWVKIYAPGGSTEQPRGQVDSIPACLEP